MSLEGEISDAISRHFRTHQRVSSSADSGRKVSGGWELSRCFSLD